MGSAKSRAVFPPQCWRMTAAESATPTTPNSANRMNRRVKFEQFTGMPSPASSPWIRSAGTPRQDSPSPTEIASSGRYGGYESGQVTAGARLLQVLHQRSVPKSADPPAATKPSPAKQSRQKPLVHFGSGAIAAGFADEVDLALEQDAYDAVPIRSDADRHVFSPPRVDGSSRAR